MNWLKIRNESVQKQKDLLNKVKEEGRGFNEDEEKTFNDLQIKIDEADKMLDFEDKASENKIVEPEVSNNIPSNIQVKDKRTSPWENGLASIALAAKEYANSKTLPDFIHNAATGGNETVPEDGGFLVGGTEATEIMKRVYDTSLIAGRCRMRRITRGNRYSAPYIEETSRATGSRLGGVRGYWLPEAGQVTTSKPKIGRFEIQLEKLIGRYDATDELLEDAPLLKQEIEDWFAEEFAWLLDDAVINGTGAGLPLGILNSQAKVRVNKESGQDANTILFDNIVNMWSRMWARSRSNAAWFINQDTEPQLFGMTKTVGTGGVPVYLPAGGLAESPYATLMGRPVIPVEQCKTLGTEGDIILSDFNQYMLAQKGRLKGAQSIHVNFDTAEQAFRFILRINGKPMWREKLTPANGSNTQSPYITLQSRN